MLFMAGHLSFFRHEKRVTEEFFNYPSLRSLQTFLRTPENWFTYAPGGGLVSFRYS